MSQPARCAKAKIHMLRLVRAQRQTSTCGTVRLLGVRAVPGKGGRPRFHGLAASLRAELESRQIPAIYDRNYYFGQLVKGKSALDIGIVEHDARHWDSPAWLHHYIHASAAFCLGVDTNTEALKSLTEKGYNTTTVDVTSDAYLGRDFDVIVAGELVEHVSQVESFLAFCARHAHSDTQLLLSTPNPHYIGFFMRMLRENMFISNAEHVSWLSPTHILELCRRTSWWLEHYTIVVGSPTRFYQKVIIPSVLASYRQRLPEWIGYAYIYVLRFGKPVSGSASKDRV